MNKPLLIAAALATNLALVAAVPTVVQELRAPLDPTSGVVLITTATLGGEAAGTGMVLTASGQVLTNYHVVEGSTRIQVGVPSTGHTYTATVVGHDATADVALLQLADASGLATITPDQQSVAVGDAVTAIGNASGGGQLASSAGSVTALNQDVTVGKDDGGAESLLGVIETSVGAVPGDSGGAMVDAQGEVVGMTTAGSQTVTRVPHGRGSTQAPVTTTSYAVPIEDALGVVERIRGGQETGSVEIGARAYLGVSVGSASGLLVGSVVAGGPAAAAGLTGGSVITALDGHAVGTHAELAAVLDGLEPGTGVSLAWIDGAGVQHSATVELGSSPVN